MEENGLKSFYTLRLTEAIPESCIMLPADWKALFKSIMTAAQYSIWWTKYNGLCEDQVRANIDTDNAAITRDHLTETGHQTMIKEWLGTPPKICNQARELAIRPLKGVTDVNKTEPGFSTIRDIKSPKLLLLIANGCDNANLLTRCS